MKKAKEKKIIYYDDELNDEFSTAEITPKKIDGSYVYVRKGFFARDFSFFIYRMVFMPWSFLYLKLKYGFSVKNRKAIKQWIKQAKKQGKGGFFLYGNHTTTDADPYVPTMTSFPKDVFVVVNPANVSMPVLGKLTPYLGALPLPDDMKATHNFIDAMTERVENGGVICIYPEAHIWPYCTFIRDFRDASFRYPVKFNKPVFCFTNVYTKRKHGRTPKMTTYVDGPFFPDENLPVGEARKKLRDEVFRAMKERSKLSDYDDIVYVRRNDSEEKKEKQTGAEND